LQKSLFNLGWFFTKSAEEAEEAANKLQEKLDIHQENLRERALNEENTIDGDTDSSYEPNSAKELEDWDQECSNSW
jgi:hypothetical protein